MMSCNGVEENTKIYLANKQGWRRSVLPESTAQPLPRTRYQEYRGEPLPGPAARARTPHRNLALTTGKTICVIHVMETPCEF